MKARIPTGKRLGDPLLNQLTRIWRRVRAPCVERAYLATWELFIDKQIHQGLDDSRCNPLAAAIALRVADNIRS